MFEPVSFLLPGPLYLVLLLLAVTIHACTSGRSSRLYRARWLLVALTALTWVLATPALGNLAARSLENGTESRPAAASVPDASTLIVVLASGESYVGLGKSRARLDASGWERVRAGIQLWKKTGGTLLFTGGTRRESDGSFAQVMRGIAIESGVPAEAIAVSPGSRTTYEDILEVREIIAGHRGPKWLVTSAMHLPRSLAVARKLGLDFIPFPCDFRQLEDPTWRAWLPNNGAATLWQSVLHEFIGRQYYRLRGWSD